MKILKLSIFLLLSYASLLWGDVSITFTYPKDGALITTTTPTIKAEILKISTKNWDRIEYRFDADTLWNTYDISGQETDSLISFSQQVDITDDKSHTFFIMASLKDSSDTTIDSVNFTVSTRPTITDQTVSPTKINPYQKNLTVELTFNKSMNVNTKPTFYFLNGETPIDTVSGQGDWTDTLVFKLQTQDLVKNPGIDAEISIKVVGARSFLGSRMAAKVLDQTIRLDTKKPTVTGVEYFPDRPIHTIKAGQCSLTVHFSEEMDTTVVPTVVLFNGSAETAFSSEGKWSDNQTYMVKNDNDFGSEFPDGQTAKVRIMSGKDVHGNEMNKSEKYQAFLFDHSAPQLQRLFTSDKAVHSQLPNQITLTLVFNEEMNKKILPTVTIKTDTIEKVFNTTGTWLDNKRYRVTNADTIDSRFAGHNKQITLSITNAKDLAGNAFDNATIRDTVAFIMDHRGPVLENVTSSRPYVNRQTFQDVQLTLNFDEPAKPLNTMIIKVQDSIEVDFSPSSATGQNLVYQSKSTLSDSVKDGALNFSFAVFEDTLGNRTTQAKKFNAILIVDTRKPDKPKINYHARSTNKNSFTFSGSKNDNNNHVGIVINNIERIPAMDTQQNWSYDYDISSLADDGQVEGKAYTFEFFARDAAGNESAVIRDTLVIDRTAPQTATINPDPFEVDYINTNSVKFGLKNTSGEKARFVFVESGIPYDIPVDNSRFFKKNENRAGLTKSFLPNVDGERDLKLYGIDTLGNRSKNPLKSWHFTVDRVAPRINKVLVNNHPTSSDAVVFVGPTAANTLDLKFLIIEETSGIQNSVLPSVKLQSNNSSNTLAFSGNGDWDNKQYSVTLPEAIPQNYKYDGLYTIQIFDITDKAGNVTTDTLNYKLYIDTHAPKKPEITNYSDNEIITNQNIITLKGTKPTNEISRILLLENGEVLDSTGWNSDKQWEISFLAAESREYNIDIVSQDLAFNKSKSISKRFIIDWVAPALSVKSPVLQVETINNRDIGHLTIYFSEDIRTVLLPAGALYIYQKEDPQQSIYPIDLTTNKNQLQAEFMDSDLARLANWLTNGMTPLLYLPAGLIDDIAGNRNLEAPAIPFSIISPSVIEEITSAETFFSPNGDGIKDSLTVDLKFNTSSEKYLTVTVYDPEQAGTVFSLEKQKINLNQLPFFTSDSSCLIDKIGSNKIRIYWNGQNSFTGKLVEEGMYNLKLSASVNTNFAFQLPIMRKVQVDTSGPSIKKIYPAIGKNEEMNLTAKTKLKLFPADSIYTYILDDNNQLKQIQYLKAFVEFGSLNDSSFTPAFRYRMEPDSVKTNNFFVFHLDSVLLNKLKNDSTVTGMQFTLTDSAKSGFSTYPVYLKIKKSADPTLNELVNFPNPFNPENEFTTFQFNTGTNHSQAELRIFDVSGELVYLKTFPAGIEDGTYIQERWDGSSLAGTKLANGVYFAIVTSGDKKSNVAKILIYRK